MKNKCGDCYNIANNIKKADFLVLNHPFYIRDVKVCRHHLAIMFDWFSHEQTRVNEITIIRLEK